MARAALKAAELSATAEVTRFRGTRSGTKRLPGGEVEGETRPEDQTEGEEESRRHQVEEGEHRHRRRRTHP